MLNYKKFIKSKLGMDILSIILGLGLAGVFKFSCDNRNCIVHRVGDLKKYEDKLKYNDKCYNVFEKMETCNKKKKIIEI